MGNSHKNIFNRYNKGLASATEQTAVNLYFDSLQETPYINKDALTEETGKLLLQNIENQIAAKSSRKYWYVAASVAAMFLFSSLCYIYFLASNTIVMKTVVAQLGLQEKVILPDASVVYLNSGSSITYPAEFGKTSREVTLQGEAYFEVDHQDEHPFIITSDHLKTQVLGTKFIVSNYCDHLPAVTVVSGKVKVTDKQSETSEIITKGQRVEYNRDKKLLIKSTAINTSDYLAWKEGRIFFNHAGIKEVLQTLHRRYNITFQLTSPLYECTTVSGTFSGTDVEQVLSSMRFINDMQYTKQQNDTIKISLKPCKN